MNSNELVKEDFRTIDNELMKYIEELVTLQVEYNKKIFEGTRDIVTNTQKSLKKLPDDFEKGLNEVRTMFWIQFGLGICLLLLSTVFYFFWPITY